MRKNNITPLFIIPVAIILLVILMSNKEINKGPDTQVNPINTGSAVNQDEIQEQQSGDNLVEVGNNQNDPDEEVALVQKPQENEAESNVENSTEEVEDNNMAYMVTLETTEGDIKIELDRDQTPNTVANFVKLAEEGFYDGTIFHRAIEDFMIQGGDPKGNGTGGPGYQFDDEPFTGEYTRGTVAMANSGPNTNGSQFFIMHKDYALPKDYVIFGKVVEGIEAVDAIATAEKTRAPNGEMSKPVNPAQIVKATVTELN